MSKSKNTDKPVPLPPENANELARMAKVREEMANKAMEQVAKCFRPLFLAACDATIANQTLAFKVTVSCDAHYDRREAVWSVQTTGTNECAKRKMDSEPAFIELGATLFDA